MDNMATLYNFKLFFYTVPVETNRLVAESV